LKAVNQKNESRVSNVDWIYIDREQFTSDELQERWKRQRELAEVVCTYYLLCYILHGVCLSVSEYIWTYV